MEKHEMSEFLNDLLAMHVRWDKMTKDDLQTICDLFSEPRKLMTVLGARLAQWRAGEVVRSFLETWLEERR